MPRWADEGGSVLSENEKERLDHDIKCREFLNAGRAIVLRQLFPMKEYPRDMIVLYAQGYSVCSYLIDLGGGGLKGRKKFLDFLGSGMDGGGRNFNSVSVSQLPDDVRAKLHPSIQGVARIDDIADAAQKAGYDSVTVANVFDNAWGEVPTKQRPRTQKDIDLDNDLLRELGIDPADTPSADRLMSVVVSDCRSLTNT